MYSNLFDGDVLVWGFNGMHNVCDEVCMGDYLVRRGALYGFRVDIYC